MMQEIVKLVEGETYDVRHDAGYADDSTAQVLLITPEDVHLEITEYSGRGPDTLERYTQLRIVNEDAEIESILDVEIVGEPED